MDDFKSRLHQLGSRNELVNAGFTWASRAELTPPFLRGNGEKAPSSAAAALAGKDSFGPNGVEVFASQASEVGREKTTATAKTQSFKRAIHKPTVALSPGFRCENSVSKKRTLSAVDLDYEALLNAPKVSVN
ncbi:hypothetical protein EYF80_034310 [Liparis tanakae]|uniref:Uncharacterized protein n=1 Tax=Liparis tanakae TaxID=230148 RepID=A0A4Z2GPB0_9TELE|nr:hypothetical protein EYF80_034310 [Liparis tanakae]